MLETNRCSKNKIRFFIIPFLWLFFINIQIKFDGQEAFYPFFRILIFITIPLALLYFLKSFSNIKGHTYRWWIVNFFILYLLSYPIITILFTNLDTRIIKDTLYTVSIYFILILFIKKYFTNYNGEINVQNLGWFVVVFAIIESVIAILMRFGLEVDLGNGLFFKQSIYLDGRLHGLLGTPSHLAPLVAAACLFLVTQSLNFHRMLMISFFISVLLMTGSRSGLIGFLVAIVPILFLKILRFRIKYQTVFLIILGLLSIFSLSLYFLEPVLDFVSIATRSESTVSEKSRWVMWSMRLLEFSNYDFFTMIFGKGHRLVDQTFNLNIELLTSYGMIYFTVFNVFYGLMVASFFFKVLNFPDSSSYFIFMLGVFFYLFSQGINFMYHQFFHFNQLFIVVMLIRYIGQNENSR